LAFLTRFRTHVDNSIVVLEGEATDEYADALLKFNKAERSVQTLEQRDTDLQNKFVERLCLPKLQEYLRLQYADLGFDETVKKTRYYVKIKDILKPKKAFVQFASTDRQRHHAVDGESGTNNELPSGHQRSHG